MVTIANFLILSVGIPLFASQAFYYSLPTLFRWFATTHYWIAVESLVTGLVLAITPILQWGWKGALTVPLTAALTIFRCRQASGALKRGEKIDVLFVRKPIPAHGKNILDFST